MSFIPTSHNHVLSANVDNSKDLSVPKSPVRVAAKKRGRKTPKARRKVRKKYISPLFDDRGFPNPQDEWESMLPDVEGGQSCS